MYSNHSSTFSTEDEDASIDGFLELNRQVMELQEEKQRLEHELGAKLQETRLLRSVARMIDPVVSEWYCKFDASKQRYYWYNASTKTSSWQMPSLNSAVGSGSPATSPAATCTSTSVQLASAM